MIALVLAVAFAQDLNPVLQSRAVRWVLAGDSTLSATSVESTDVYMERRTPRDTFYRPRFSMGCRRYKTIMLSGQRALEAVNGDQPLVFRVDGDRAVSATAHHGGGMVSFPGSLDDWVRRLAGRDWLQVRYRDFQGVHDATFDLRDIDAPLRSFVALCGLRAEPVEQAIAARTGRAVLPQPVASAVEERRIGRWRVRSSTDRFTGVPTVSAVLSSVRQQGPGTTPGSLILRVMEGRLEAFLDQFALDARVEAEYDSTNEWHTIDTNRGTGLTVFFARPGSVARDLLAHRTLVLRGGGGQTTFALEMADSALAPVLAAAGIRTGQ